MRVSADVDSLPMDQTEGGTIWHCANFGSLNTNCVFMPPNIVYNSVLQLDQRYYKVLHQYEGKKGISLCTAPPQQKCQKYQMVMKINFQPKYIVFAGKENVSNNLFTHVYYFDLRLPKK